MIDYLTKNLNTDLMKNQICYTSGMMIRGAQINNAWMTSLLLTTSLAISAYALRSLGLYLSGKGGIKKVDIIRQKKVEIEPKTPPKKTWTLLNKKTATAPTANIEYSIETKEILIYKKLGELALKAFACTVACHLAWTFLESAARLARSSLVSVPCNDHSLNSLDVALWKLH